MNNNSTQASLAFLHDANLSIIDSFFVNNSLKNPVFSLFEGFLKIKRSFFENNQILQKSFFLIEKNEENQGNFNMLWENCEISSNSMDLFLNLTVFAIFSVKFDNLFIKNNVFSSGFAIISYENSQNPLKMTNFSIIENIYSSNFLVLEAKSLEISSIFLNDFLMFYGNKNAGFLGKSSLKFTGNLQISLNFLKILENFSCNAVCGLFFARNYDTDFAILSIDLSNSLIQNNIVNFYDTPDYRGGVSIFLEKADFFSIFSTFFINNSINTQETTVIGDPCFINLEKLQFLHINSSKFVDNSSPGSSSCINFLGDALLIKNTEFRKNSVFFQNYDTHGPLRLSDSFLVNFENVDFSENFGFFSTVFSLVSQQENLFMIYMENVRITTNFIKMTSIYLDVENYQISWISVSFLHNICENWLFKMENIGEIVEKHVLLMKNCTFFNTTGKSLYLANIGGIY